MEDGLAGEQVWLEGLAVCEADELEVAGGVLDDYVVRVDVQVDDIARVEVVQAFEDFFEVHRNLVLLEKGLVTGDMKDISWCLLVMKKTVLFIFIYVILPEVSKFY